VSGKGADVLQSFCHAVSQCRLSGCARRSLGWSRWLPRVWGRAGVDWSRPSHFASCAGAVATLLTPSSSAQNVAYACDVPNIGAATAEKLEGTLCVLDVNPLIFPCLFLPPLLTLFAVALFCTFLPHIFHLKSVNWGST